MNQKTINLNQGHWILAKMGKRVLRPGGKELTLKLIHNLHISESDDVVEFAPGLGFTAMLTLRQNPKSYTGIELNEEAACILKKQINTATQKIIIANAAATTLETATKSKVYGEAMLTMHANHRKSDIIREAARIIKPGGLYGIHELCLTPNELPDTQKAAIQKELAEIIKVNARPLTIDEWKGLLENEGFKVKTVETNPMRLLEPKRVIDDEGILRTLKIGFNVLRYPKARKRILAMRKVFRKYNKNMCAVSIIAEKL